MIFQESLFTKFKTAEFNVKHSPIILFFPHVSSANKYV